MRAAAGLVDPTVAAIAAASAGRLLTAADEIALGRAVQAGDLGARNLLVERNMGLVWKQAHALRGRGLEVEDLASHGVEGLMHAADRFDPERGLKFSTSATYWVRQRMLRAIENERSLIRLPVHVGARHRAIARATDQLRQELGRRPTQEEIAAAMGLTVAQLERARHAWNLQHPERLDAPRDEADERDGHQLVADPTAVDALAVVEAAADQERAAALVAELLGRLPPHMAEILRLRFGIDDRGRTLEECGAVLGLTRERVRQVEREALTRLREAAAGLQLTAAAD